MEASDIKRVITAISEQFKLDPIAEVTYTVDIHISGDFQQLYRLLLLIYIDI